MQMRTVAEWKTTLREALKASLRAKDADATSALRETIAALDNAEAADLSAAPAVEEGVIAGGVSGLGRGDVPRRVLTPEEVASLIDAEARDRREAAKVYAAAGKHEVAAALHRGAEVLEALRNPRPQA